MLSTVYKNVLTNNELTQLVDYYKDKPAIHSEPNVINKNLEYHVPEDFSYKLLNPKINSILGKDHEFYTGSYKECLKPYPVHTDSIDLHAELKTVMGFSNKHIHNVAVLIPLVEGPEFCTVVFDIFSKEEFGTKRLATPNSLQANDFTHTSFSTVSHLPIATEYHWQLGDILIWDKSQYHVSTDFAKHGLIKKFLILFMA